MVGEQSKNAHENRSWYKHTALGNSKKPGVNRLRCVAGENKDGRQKDTPLHHCDKAVNYS